MTKKGKKPLTVRIVRGTLQILLIAAIALSLVGMQPLKQVQAATVVNLPSAGETYLRQGYPTRNYGGSPTVSVSNGTNKQNSLYKWNLSTIPSGSTVTAASVTFYVTDGSTADFNLFSMRRAWVEGTSADAESSNSANYNTYDGTNSWGTAGAMSTTLDRYNTDLWDATGGSGGTFSATGNVTIQLNASGVSVVQGWVNDSLSNFGATMQFTGTTGTADYWIVASKENTSGYAVPTLNVTYEPAGPTIFTSLSQLQPFITPPGTPSDSQSYTVSGVNLTNDIDITAPGGFEVSIDDTTWLNTLTLTQSGGTVESTPIYVRMTGATEGEFSGNITHVSSPAIQKDVAVSGKVSNEICVSSRITASADDVEERMNTGTTNGDVDLDGDTSTKSLQMYRAYGGSTTDLNWWGLRFQNVAVPVGATIVSSTITFRANATSGATDSGMTLWGQAADSPATFTTTDYDVSSRSKTTASATWTVPQWTSGQDYETPELTGIVQEIVSRPGWAQNNALVIMGQTTVSQNRSAISRDSTNGSTLGPLLEVCYTQSTEPMITTSVSALEIFAALPGVPSEPQSYTVGGFNLEEEITVMAPDGFQLSTAVDGSYTQSIILSETGGTVFVRLFSTIQETYSGNIAHTSSGATQKNVAVTGTVSNQICYNDQEFVAVEDTYMSSINPTYNYGGVDLFKVTNNNGGNSRGALLRWDLDSLPGDAVVSSASLKLYVSTASTQAYNLYEMMQPWVEGTLTTGTASTTSANWQTYDGVNTWGTPGAASTTLDRYNVNLWSASTSTFTPTGSKTIALNGDGLFVVQEWITAPASNLGVTMQSYSTTSGSDDLQISSSENTTAANRPTLILDYCVGANSAPDQPVLVQPADDATNVATPPTLEVTVTDSDEDLMDVSFWGRPVSEATPAEDFLFIAVPDTQNLATSSPTVMSNQFQWIANRYTTPGAGNPALVYVTNLGDIVNTAGSSTEWTAADTAYDKLDVAGVPYSVGPGNHDLGTLYSTNFGSARFTGKSWYKGYYTSGTDNYNNYSFFSAGGMDFIVINLEYSAGTGALDWAEALMKANPSRRAIVVQHDILNTTNGYVNTTIYPALSDNPNLFLMLCGHMHSGSDGSAYLLETRSGMQPVHILQTDYQDQIGGIYPDYLRLLTFKPSTDQIYAQVFSPNAPGGNLTSESNYEQFTMAYDMVGTAAAPFVLIGTDEDVASGGNALVSWDGLLEDTEYEWYAVVDDGSTTTTGPTWSFTTSGGVVNQPPVVSDIPGGTIPEGFASTFLTITLDAYVTDPDNTDEQMAWTYSGNTQLSVTIVDRVATISIPNADWNGSETITFRATDPGSLFDEDSAVFTVTGVNDAPIITAQAQVLTVPEETALDILLAHLTVTDVDNDYPDDFALTVLSGTNYQVSGNTITPDTGFYGELTVPVKVNDGLADSNTYDLTVTVTQGGVTPVLPSSFWGLLHFSSGDVGAPIAGDTLYAYLDSETIPITSVLIGSDGSDLTYAINVPAYPNGTHPTTVKFTAGGPVLGITNWTTGTNVQFNLHPPLPNAGGPYVTQASIGSISLAGTVSDWGNDVVTTQWDLDEDGLFDEASILNPTFYFASAGTYPVSLKAVDAQGGEGSYTSHVFAITLNGLTGQVYNGSPHPVTVTGVESPFSYNVLYSGSATAPTNAGTYTVLVRILSGTDLLLTYETSMVIAKGTQTITVTTHAPATATYNSSFTVAGTASSSLPVTYSSGSPSICSVTGATFTMLSGTGTCVVQYDQAGNDNYSAAPRVTENVTASKATATVTLENLSHTYDGTAKTATATTTPPGLTVNITYDPASPINAGNYAVTATIADTNYTGTAAGTLVIAKATQTITVTTHAPTTAAYNSSFTVAGTASSGLTVTYSSGSPSICSVTGTTFTMLSGTGTCVVQYDQAGNANYNTAIRVTENVTATKATATVTLSNLTQSYDGTPKSVTVTTVPASLTVAVTYDGSSTPPSAAGSYAVVATVNDSNYAGSASGTLVISGLSHSIDLVAGWNLVSFNLTLADTDIADVLAGILDDVILVYGWNGETGTWKRFDPAVGFGNTLETLDKSMGFWINMEAARTLTVLGTAPTTTNITLYEGWNLIGWPSDNNTALPAALAEIVGNYDLIMAYHANNTADPWKLFDPEAPAFANDLTAMAPGWGYWINMTVADTLPIGY